MVSRQNISICRVEVKCHLEDIPGEKKPKLQFFFVVCSSHPLPRLARRQWGQIRFYVAFGIIMHQRFRCYQA